mmetsp:Transcript_85186/g.264676  ORF Transcript_85186/g.264676 Transcript_85186/m.264676 type:complete len:310 (+) Transcript_85186:75-1004(+)
MFKWSTALLHFVCVETRPLLIVLCAVVTLLRDTAVNLYEANSSVLEIPAAASCTIGQFREESASLYWQGLMSLDLYFHGSNQCAKVAWVGENYGTYFAIPVVGVVVITFLVLLVLFAKEAAFAENFGFNSGEYVVFTMKLEKRFVYKVIVYTNIVSAVFLWSLASMFGCIVGSCPNVSDMVLYIRKSLVQVLFLCYSFHSLLRPCDCTEFETWDEVMIKQVKFRRPWHGVFISSNDRLYQDLVFAGLAGARGNVSRLDELCDDADQLWKAMGVSTAPTAAAAVSEVSMPEVSSDSCGSSAGGCTPLLWA